MYHFGEYHIRKQRMLFCVSCAMRIRFLHCLRFDLNVNSVSSYIHCICDTLQNGAIGWNCWIKSLFLFSLRTKYSRNFVKLRLSHWCHMDYFNDVLAMFLSLERVMSLWRVRGRALQCICDWKLLRATMKQYLGVMYQTYPLIITKKEEIHWL